MPLIYRAMQADGAGPMIGHTGGDTLGVREGVDITPSGGMVYPNTGGMSVAPSKEDLPDHLIPKRLRKQGYPGARRSNNRPETFPWRMGEGEFEEAQLCDKLRLRPDPHRPVSHGFVEPDQPMPFGEHQAAIEATRPDWAQEQW
jgi:hypothetical protein